MHINSSSGTRDSTTDADNAEIKFMFSSERFSLAMAQDFDLGALLPWPSFLFLHQRPNTKPKTFLQSAERFRNIFYIFPLNPCIRSWHLQYQPLSVRPVKTCGFSYLLSVSAISSSILPAPEKSANTCVRICG